MVIEYNMYWTGPVLLSTVSGIVYILRLKHENVELLVNGAHPTKNQGEDCPVLSSPVPCHQTTMEIAVQPLYSETYLPCYLLGSESVVMSAASGPSGRSSGRAARLRRQCQPGCG